MIHCSSPKVAPRSAWIAGLAMCTTVESRPTMKRPKHTAIRVRPGRPPDGGASVSAVVLGAAIATSSYFRA